MRSISLVLRVCLAIVVALACGVLATAPASAQVRDSSARASSLSTSPYGNSYGDWAAAWWQWTLALPVPENPLFDETGALCGNGQSGPVWFLGGVVNVSGTAERTCAVPSGKALFFPILNVECSNVEGNGDTPVALRACASGFMDNAAGLFLEIDGDRISVRRQRVTSPSFHFSLPEDNFLQFFGVNAPAGSCLPGATACEPYQAAGDGAYVMLGPLSDGAHTIHFGGSFPAFNFSLDITYHLVVGGV